MKIISDDFAQWLRKQCRWSKNMYKIGYDKLRRDAVFTEGQINSVKVVDVRDDAVIFKFDKCCQTTLFTVPKKFREEIPKLSKANDLWQVIGRE